MHTTLILERNHAQYTEPANETTSQQHADVAQHPTYHAQRPVAPALQTVRQEGRWLHEAARTQHARQDLHGLGAANTGQLTHARLSPLIRVGSAGRSQLVCCLSCLSGAQRRTTNKPRVFVGSAASLPQTITAGRPSGHLHWNELNKGTWAPASSKQEQTRTKALIANYVSNLDQSYRYGTHESK